MRALWYGALVLLAVGGPALAQSALEGPLAAPDSAPAAKAKPAKSKARKKTAKVKHATPATATAGGFDAGGSMAQPVLNRSLNVPADPLSFGMKWNGSNDSARDTRVQNYDGSAQGTGAEVGMKLHF